MAEELTTIPVAKTTNERIKKLAAERAKNMGLTQPLTQRAYLEILVTEEEGRTKNDKKQKSNDLRGPAAPGVVR